jgi:hypothetical protein
MIRCRTPFSVCKSVVLYDASHRWIRSLFVLEREEKNKNKRKGSFLRKVSVKSCWKSLDKTWSLHSQVFQQINLHWTLHSSAVIFHHVSSLIRNRYQEKKTSISNQEIILIAWHGRTTHLIFLSSSYLVWTSSSRTVLTLLRLYEPKHSLLWQVPFRVSFGATTIVNDVFQNRLKVVD